MGDFDWQGTCAAVTASGACTDCMAGDTQGNFYSSYPLQEDGNYKFFLYTDAYKAVVSKSSGEDAEEDVYEAYYLGLLLQGKKPEIPDGHVIRIGGEKFMHVRVLDSETYMAKIKDAEGNESSYPVTIPEVHVMKKGSVQLFCGSKGGYFFMVKSVAKGMGDSGADALAAMAIGFYYACGADQ